MKMCLQSNRRVFDALKPLPPQVCFQIFELLSFTTQNHSLGPKARAVRWWPKLGTLPQQFRRLPHSKKTQIFCLLWLITIRVLNWNQLNVQKFTQDNKTTPDFRLQGKWVRIPSEPRVCKGFRPKTYPASHRGFLKSTTYTLQVSYTLGPVYEVQVPTLVHICFFKVLNLIKYHSVGKYLSYGTVSRYNAKIII